MRGTRVLVVDDDKLVLKLVRKMLAELVLEVVTCTRAQDGLASLLDGKSEGRPFDLLIVDLEMPGERGTVLIKAVRELEAQEGRDVGNRTPIVLLTAEDPKKIPSLESDDLMRLGIIYLNKASMVERLGPTLEKALGQ